MMKNTLIWTVVMVMLSAATFTHAQSISAPSAGRVTVSATPLTDAAQRAAIALAKTPMASQPAKPKSSARKCATGLALGTAGGAVVGFGSALALLISTGGSDSAAGILGGFSSYGAVLGLMIGGTVGCQ